MNEKAPAAPPLHPLQLARSQADLHFRASGPQADQVAQFTAAKLWELFFPSLPRSVQDSTTDSVIFPVTLTSSVVVAAKKPTLSKTSPVHKLSVDSNQQPSSHIHAYLNFTQHKPMRAKEETTQVLPLVLPSSMALPETLSIKQSRRTQNVQTLAIFLMWRMCLVVKSQKNRLEAWDWLHTLLPGIGSVRNPQCL